VLARGSAADIRRQVQRHVRELSPGGGYIFGTIHNVQDDVSADNFMAMWRAFDEMRTY